MWIYITHNYENLWCASHWHDKRFTSWHAIWRANDGITHEGVRGDAWRCGSGEVVRAMSWRKFWYVQKYSKMSRLITTTLYVKYTCVTPNVTHFVNSLIEGTTWRKLCVTLLSWQTSCHWKGMTWHAILRGIAGTKFVPLWSSLDLQTHVCGSKTAEIDQTFLQTWTMSANRAAVLYLVMDQSQKRYKTCK